MKVEQSKSHWRSTWWPETESDEEENEEKTEKNDIVEGNEDKGFGG